MKITIYVMLAIGAAFWVGALVIPGMQVWMIVLASTLIAYCVYWLLTLPGGKFDPDRESE